MRLPVRLQGQRHRGVEIGHPGIVLQAQVESWYKKRRRGPLLNRAYSGRARRLNQSDAQGTLPAYAVPATEATLATKVVGSRR